MRPVRMGWPDITNLSPSDLYPPPVTTAAKGAQKLWDWFFPPKTPGQAAARAFPWGLALIAGYLVYSGRKRKRS